jgi:hypothetical protein
MVSRKVLLAFPQAILGEPVLYTLGRDFNVVPNIRGASVTEEQALMAVELDGDPAEVERAILWLRQKGVVVESLKPDR